MDRALSLAEKIAANGAFILSRTTVVMFSLASQAPIALRSAKLAISRAQELSLESGELFHLRSSDVFKRFFRAGFRKSSI